MTISKLVALLYAALSLMSACQSAPRGAEATREPAEIARPAEPAAPPLSIAADGSDGACDKACGLVADCVPDARSACATRCRQSVWVEPHRAHCLALRILWIDEEGCQRIAPTWQLFDDHDDCSGPPPDER